jgi:uncharacterized membrane protein
MPSAPLHLVLGANKPGFDLLLVGHVACTLFGFGALVTSGIQATRLRRRGAGGGETLRRYFAPGVNLVGRTVYGVPLFGFALLADSGGQLRIGEAWVVGGLASWAVAVALAEGFLWPAERRIQAAVAAGAPGVGGDALPAAVLRDCRLVGLLGAVLGAIFVAATVLMVARPG